ncbi:helix-turn-helix domain-containing protein [Streptomyces sp. NPDC059629]|uniref:helix-turn-helix domain-containing protein n=1 Tax=Streptomyces sp. NPDC059629 TaxID=3346889 RepID=UPI00367B618A
MSDTTRTLHAVPDPEPLAGLTGAPAAIYAELVKLTDDDTATAAELALAAGLGRSTTGKALVTLEEHGLATRTPGGHDGPRRTPDRWRTAPTGQNTATDTETGQEPVTAEPTDSASNTPEPSADNKQSDNASADEATPNTSDTPDTDDVTAADVTPDTPASDLDAERSHDGASGDEGSHPAQDNHSADTEEAPVALETDPDQPPVTQGETNALPDEKKRLAPGALRQMVIDHLSAHPGEAFTATGISRVIEKSSGAIANALDKLVKQNIAEQVSNRPRTYRLAAPQANV